jgi:hypothetical protein
MEIQDPLLLSAVAIIVAATISTGRFIIQELRVLRRLKAEERYRRAIEVRQLLK